MNFQKSVAGLSERAIGLRNVTLHIARSQGFRASEKMQVMELGALSKRFAREAGERHKRMCDASSCCAPQKSALLRVGEKVFRRTLIRPRITKCVLGDETRKAAITGLKNKLATASKSGRFGRYSIEAVAAEAEVICFVNWEYRGEDHRHIGEIV